MFSISNTSDEVVHITGIETSCGCTAVELSNERILPGESIDARMVVELQGQYGKRSFQATIRTDSRLAPTISLQLSGDVAVSELGGELPFDIGSFPPDSNIGEAVAISKGNTPDAVISSVERVSGQLQVEAVDLEDAAFFKLHVSGRSPKEIGRFTTTVQLAADGAAWRRRTVSISGLVSSRWRYPEEVYLGFVGSGEAITKRVQIEDAFPEGASTPILDVSIQTSELGEVDVSANDSDSSGVVLVFTLRHNDTPGAISEEAEVLLRTSDGREHVIHIRIFGRRL